MGLTSDIGTFVSSIGSAAIPPDAMPVVRSGFTDCVAVMVAGRREEVARIVARQSGAEVRDDRILLNGIAAPDAALVYGTAAHALD